MAIRPPSIGGSYELQGTPNMYENLDLELLKYKKDKEERKRKADKDLLDRYSNTLNVTGYDPIYNKQIAAAASGIMDELNKAQAGKYLNTIESNPGFRKKVADFQILAGNAKTMTGVINQAEKEAADVANVGKINVSKDTFDALNEARIQGDVTPRLEQLFGRNAMGVDRNKFYSIVPPPNFDYIDKFEKTQIPVFGKTKIERDAGDVFKTTGGTSFKENENRALAKQIIDNPNSAIGIAAIKAHNGDKLAAEEELFQNLKFRYKPEYEESIQEKSGGAGVSEEDIIMGLKTPQKINLAYKPKAGETPIETTYDSRGYIGFKKPIQTREKLSKGMIADNNELITKEGVSKDVSYGSITFPKIWTRQLPAGGEQIKIGSIVTDGQLSNLRKRAAIGDLKVSDFIQEKPFVNASYVEQEQQEGVDALGNPIYKKIEKQIAIPFDKAQNTLRQNGVDVEKIKQSSEEFNKNIDGIYGVKKVTPTITTKEQFDALPSGATYYKVDGKLYKKP